MNENQNSDFGKQNQENKKSMVSRRKMIKTLGLSGALMVASGGLARTLHAQSNNPHDKIGELSELDTNDKSNIVHALNETLRRSVDHENQSDSEFAQRGVNVKWFGAKGDGVSDDTEAIRAAIRAADLILFPQGTYIVTDTITVGPRYKTLRGIGSSLRHDEKNVRIKYDGAINRHKAVVVLGQNGVDAEPALDGTNNIVQNICIDANHKCGFCIYGTYITNESLVDHLVLKNSLEYNGYFARGWYATITNITSMACEGRGLAFGMPLKYQDGTEVTWQTRSPIELNNIKIDNVRSIDAGQYYSKLHPRTFNPANRSMNDRGYGIGAGIGNGFRLNNFLSEKSGGVNLYVYTGPQPVKSIGNGYLENSCYQSGLDPATAMANMIINHVHQTGGMYTIENLFFNYNSGGIYFDGEPRKVKLVNIHQPRFLKALNGMNQFDLHRHVLKDNVYYLCGYCNTDEREGFINVLQEVAANEEWIVHTTPIDLHRKLIFVKGNGITPGGSIVFTDEDGKTYSEPFPGLSSGKYEFVRIANGNLVSISRGGTPNNTAGKVTFKVIDVPVTY